MKFHTAVCASPEHVGTSDHHFVRVFYRRQAGSSLRGRDSTKKTRRGRVCLIFAIASFIGKHNVRHVIIMAYESITPWRKHDISSLSSGKIETPRLSPFIREKHIRHSFRRRTRVGMPVVLYTQRQPVGTVVAIFIDTRRSPQQGRNRQDKRHAACRFPKDTHSKRIR